MLYPDLINDSIFDLNFEKLTNIGICALIVDLDNTMIPRDHDKTNPLLKKWVIKAQEHDMKICIISNNVHKRVKVIADELNLPLVSSAIKPFSMAFKKGLKILDSCPEETAVIGDQIFTDVLGGNLAGMTTVLVEPLSDVDLIHTKALRIIERFIIKIRNRKYKIDGNGH